MTWMICSMQNRMYKNDLFLLTLERYIEEVVS